MVDQYIVAVFLDGTLNVDATGPFRSREKAERVAERINAAGGWSDTPIDFTITAQVVRLRAIAELVAEAAPPAEHA